jgi:taurine dioxygenase
VYVISNKVVDGRQIGDSAAGLNWHTDMNYHRTPALCTMLHAIEVPKEGSDTLIADACAAWNALPADRRETLDGLKVEHSFSKLSNRKGRSLSKEQSDSLPDVIHPLVRRHPHDGRKALFLASSRSIKRIVGLPEEEGLTLMSELLEFATQDQFVYRHKWSVGDVLAWDDRCTLHRGTPFDTVHDVRHIHRTWVRGEVPH